MHRKKGFNQMNSTQKKDKQLTMTVISTFFLFSRQVWNILIQHFTQTALQKTLLTETKNQISLKFKLALIMSITKIVHCVFDCRSTKAFMSPIETTFAVNKWTEKKLMEFDHNHYSAYFWTTHYLSCVVINSD